MLPSYLQQKWANWGKWYVIYGMEDFNFGSEQTTGHEKYLSDGMASQARRQYL